MIVRYLPFQHRNHIIQICIITVCDIGYALSTSQWSMLSANVIFQFEIFTVLMYVECVLFVITVCNISADEVRLNWKCLTLYQMIEGFKNT